MGNIGVTTFYRIVKFVLTAGQVKRCPAEKSLFKDFLNF